jgi:hypothetical protein
MSNVVRFPSRWRRSPSPVVDPMDELAALELELARVKLTQIKDEARRVK